jgi:CheY-like chemotaxis protein
MVTALLADGISLRLDLSIDVGLFRADPAQLRTALLNLTLNARDSMKLTAGVVTISACNLKTSTSVVGLGHDIPAGDYVALSISDQGLGMSAEVLRQATEPFFTTKPSGEGTGLGLPMVVGFAAQSGGTLTINSSPGNGTTATILLPRIENSRLPPGANSVVQPTSMLSGLRLLMVEDRADLTAVLTTSCRRVGLRVTAATTAEEAIGLLTSHTYDLVLSDVQLSGPGSGLDVLAHAQSLQPPIPVMLMSGFAGAAEDEELALQNHRVLRKPFRSKALMDALAELVVLG